MRACAIGGRPENNLGCCFSSGTVHLVFNTGLSLEPEASNQTWVASQQIPGALSLPPQCWELQPGLYMGTRHQSQVHKLTHQAHDRLSYVPSPNFYFPSFLSDTDSSDPLSTTPKEDTQQYEMLLRWITTYMWLLNKRPSMSLPSYARHKY